MSTNRLNGINNYWLIFIYTLLFVFVGLYVFVANDESQPIIELFQWNYLIPVFIYACGTVGVSLVIFLLLQKILNKSLSLFISILAGLPAGIMLMIALFSLLSTQQL